MLKLHDNSRQSFADLLIVLCFFLSGLAALVYQTVWARMFSISFGTSEMAIATVLAAYMGGLALGSAVAGRFADRIKRPVLFYAVLEAAIAISALCVPFLILLAGNLYVAFVGAQPELPAGQEVAQLTYYLVSTGVIILVPTALMGATLPILAHHLVRTNQHIGPRIGALYALNTLGAVAGVLIGSFLLLPSIGLWQTVWVGVFVNALVFVLASWSSLIVRFSPSGVSEAPASSDPKNPRLSRAGRWICLIMAVSGAMSFVYEVFWTRLLGHVLGSSIYAFAIMLSTFLVGIVIGSAIAGMLARRRELCAMLLAGCQILIGLMSIVAYEVLNGMDFSNVTRLHQLGFSALAMLPATVFIGATFPLAVRLAAESETQIGKVSASVYAWNTVGAIIGALCAGFVLLPGLGFGGTLLFAVVVNAILACVVLLVLTQRTRSAWAFALATLVIFVVYQPDRPEIVMSYAAPGFVRPSAGTEEFYAVGRASTVLVTRTQQNFEIRTNGLPEAQVTFSGSRPAANDQRWLGFLPVLARPDLEDMLVIGLGGGVALEGVPPSVQRIDVIELEEQVLKANQLMSPYRHIDPLADPRVTVVINDARNALRLTDRRYDAIVSQPSHPWTAGASHLFSLEFVRQVKSRLEEDGVFVMWMNTEFLTADLLGSLAATLQAEFAHVRMYKPLRQTLKFIASDAPVDIETQIALTARPLIDDMQHFASNGILSIVDVIAALQLDEAGIAKLADGHPPVTDNRNLMATHSRSSADGLLEDDLVALLAASDPLLDRASWLRQGLGTDDLVEIGKKLIMSGQSARTELLLQTIDSQSHFHTLTAMLLLSRGRADLAHESLMRALEEDPENQQAIYLLIEPELSSLFVGAEANPVFYELLPNMNGSLANFANFAIAVHGGNYAEAVALDEVLLLTPYQVLWHGNTLSWRALLRMHLAHSNVPLDLPAALRLADLGMYADATIQGHQLRAELAYRTEAVEAYRESAIFIGAAIARIVRARMNAQEPVSPSELQSWSRQVDTLHSRLSEEPIRTAWPERVDWALGQITDLQELLRGAQ